MLHNSSPSPSPRALAPGTTPLRSVTPPRRRSRRGVSSRYAPGMPVPYAAVSRRLEALVAQGWDEAEIAKRAGVPLAATTIRPAMPQDHEVPYALFAVIDAAFRQLRNQYGGNDEARARAVREGYAPWITWPGDDGIDDLSATPHTKGVSDADWRASIRARHPRVRKSRASSPKVADMEMAEIVEHLRAIMQVRRGSTPIDIARAAGVHQGVVYRLLTFPTPTLAAQARPLLAKVTAEDVQVPPTRVVDANPLRSLVESTINQGWTMEDIDREANANEGARPLREVMEQRPSRMTLGRFERVENACRALRKRAPMGAGGVAGGVKARVLLRRRVEALAVLGWSEAEVAERADVPRDAVREAAAPYVSAALFARVDGVYQELVRLNGPDDALRAWARGEGFAPSAAWPDGALDVVEAVPDLARIEDVSWRDTVQDRYALLGAFA